MIGLKQKQVNTAESATVKTLIHNRSYERRGGMYVHTKGSMLAHARVEWLRNAVTISRSAVVNGSNRADAALRLVYKPVMYRVQCQFEAVGNAELVKDIVQMVFYGLLGDEKFFADFLVPEALCDELHNFFLTVA